MIKATISGLVIMMAFTLLLIGLNSEENNMNGVADDQHNTHNEGERRDYPCFVSRNGNDTVDISCGNLECVISVETSDNNLDCPVEYLCTPNNPTCLSDSYCFAL